MVLKLILRAYKTKRLDWIIVCFSGWLLTVKRSTAENVVSLRAKRSGVFATVVSGFAKFLSDCFTFVFDSTELSMLIGLNRLAVLIPIVRGFSLLPFKTLTTLVLLCGIQTKTGMVSAVSVVKVVFCWRRMNVQGCLLLKTHSLMLSISVGLEIWQSYELLHWHRRVS